MSSNSQQDGSKGKQAAPANSEDSPGDQTLQMLLAERRRATAMELQALEQYQTLQEKNLKRGQEAVEVFLKASGAKVSADNSPEVQPLQMVLAERRKAVENEQQALKQYQALKKMNLEREREALEVFLKANGAKASLDSKERKKQDTANQDIRREEMREWWLKMQREREQWLEERKRKAHSDDPVTKKEREEYIKALQEAWDNHKPHERPCFCLWNPFMFSPFALVVAFGADKKVGLRRDTVRELPSQKICAPQ